MCGRCNNYYNNHAYQNFITRASKRN
jgi:hypothetical protein